MRRLLLPAIIFLSFSLAAMGQTTQPASPSETVEAAPESGVGETVPNIPQTKAPTCRVEDADLWHCSKFTGSWHGVRNQLADKGICISPSITQIIQNNAHGGYRTNDAFKYSGSADLTIKLDTTQMGLWQGGEILLNAEPKWGNGVNRHVGSLSPVNLDAVKPNMESSEMTLSEWIYFQHLWDHKLILVAGKLDGSRAFDRNVFANDERTQFMNVGLRNNLIIPTFLPYTNLGVGAILNPTDWLSIATAVADSEGSADTTGFNTTFHGPTHTTVIHEWDFKIKPCGQPGNQRIGFVWSSREFPNLNPVSPFKETGPLMMKLLGPKLAGKVVRMIAPFDASPDNVGIYYNFDQYLYHEECDPTQGVGLFGRFGWARGDVNPLEYFYSLGVGGKGVIPERDCDTFGVGWYYMDLSHNMPEIYNHESGVELFYNVEVTPWLHITPDMQVVVDPGGIRDKNAFVWGLRFQMDL